MNQKRIAEVTLSILGIVGIGCLVFAFLPVIRGHDELASLTFHVTDEPFGPTVFALLFAVCIWLAVQTGQVKATLPSLPFLALSILPALSQGPSETLIKRLDLISNIQAEQQATLDMEITKIRYLESRFSEKFLIKELKGKGRGSHNLGVSVDQGFCTLNRVSGKFGGYGEVVKVQPQGNVWHLIVEQGSLGTDITGDAICIRYPTPKPEA